MIEPAESFIEDVQVIREILMHMGLWLVRSRPPPKIHDPPNIEYATADLQIQPHTDIIGACPRPDRGATRNTPGMIIYNHDFLTHLKICVMEMLALIPVKLAFLASD